MDMMFRLTKQIAPYLAIVAGLVGCVHVMVFPIGSVVNAYLAALAIALHEWGLAS